MLEATEPQICSTCQSTLNYTVIGGGHTETCVVRLAATVRFYEKAFTSIWNLLVLIEAGEVSPAVLPKLRAEVARLVFGYETDPDTLMAASVEVLQEMIKNLAVRNG